MILLWFFQIFQEPTVILQTVYDDFLTALSTTIQLRLLFLVSKYTTTKHVLPEVLSDHLGFFHRIWHTGTRNLRPLYWEWSTTISYIANK